MPFLPLFFVLFCSQSNKNFFALSVFFSCASSFPHCFFFVRAAAVRVGAQRRDRCRPKQSAPTRTAQRQKEKDKKKDK
jgi:hypothetical protein